MLLLQYFIIVTPNLRELWARASAYYAVNVHVYMYCMLFACKWQNHLLESDGQMPITESVESISRDGLDMPYIM